MNRTQKVAFNRREEDNTTSFPMQITAKTITESFPSLRHSASQTKILQKIFVEARPSNTIRFVEPPGSKTRFTENITLPFTKP